MSSLKSIKGKFYSQCKVIMLPTNELSPLKIDLYDQLLFNSNTNNSDEEIGQHLYIVNEDEIKLNDFYYSPTYGILERKTEVANVNLHEKGCRKIIATTDPNVFKWFIYDGDYFDSEARKIFLPLPSHSFIKKFVTEYNKKNIIEDILVEYEHKTKRTIGQFWDQNNEYNLKIDLGNTITIKKENPTLYSEKDIKLLIDIWKDSQTFDNLKYGEIPNETFDVWLMKNL